MIEIKVTLNIGISNAEHEDVLEIDQDEWDDCNSEREREKLMNMYWQDWSNNYIDGSCELINKESDNEN